MNLRYNKYVARVVAPIFIAVLTVPLYGVFFLFEAQQAEAAPASTIPQSFPTVSATELGGLIFRDYNANGILDSQEPGFTSVGGTDSVTVTAYTDANTVGGTTTTGTDGTWVISGLSAATNYRVEVSGLPTYLQAGAHTDAAAESLTAFAAAGENDVLIAVNDPGDWCQSVDQLELAIPCYIQGDPNGGGSAENLEAFVTFDYIGTAVDQKILNNQVGSTWGVAYDQERGLFYSAAFIKRHSGFGPLGIGGIYSIDPADGTQGTLTTVTGLTTIVRDLSADADDPSHDDAAFAAVGKLGLGDMDFDNASRTLYVMNLEAKQVEVMSVSTAGVVTPGAPITLSDPGCSNGTFRPFALTVKEQKLYIGSTCDASSGTSADLSVHVQQYDSGTTTLLGSSTNFASEREWNTDISGSELPSEWQPWSDDGAVTDLFGVGTYGQAAFVKYHSPMLVDIEFDNDGSLILGIVDRVGHQYGVRNFAPNQATRVRTINTSGDLIRMCYDHVGQTYIEEGSAGCAQNSGNGNGPSAADIPEYYEGDFYCRPNGNMVCHYETSHGGLLQVAGEEDILFSGMDASDINSGGVYRLSNTTGQKISTFELYNSGAFPSAGTTNETFAKAAGLGDIEAACTAAPLEVGNRVWIDADSDGVQDPSEAPLAGVTVELFDGASVVATAVTDAQGRYVFTSWDYDVAGAWTAVTADPDPNDYQGIVPGGVGRGTSYTIRIDRTQTAISTPGYDLATANNGMGTTPDQNDSDGTLSGNYSQYAFTTGSAGYNDHTVDFGFSSAGQRIGNLLFHDVDNDGIAEAGEPGIENATVELWEDTTADNAFNPLNDTMIGTTTTDSSGKYWFEGLADGTYFAAIPTTGNASVTIGAATGINLSSMYNSTAQGLSAAFGGNYEPVTNSNADNVDDGRDNGNVAIPAGYITMSSELVMAEATEPTGETPAGGVAGDDETEANAQAGSSSPDDNSSNLTVDFGFFELPDISVDKLVEGSDADTTATNAEVIDIPPAAGTTSFEYHISLTNDSSLTSASGVVLTDYIPEGITIDSVVSASAGSVSTTLPVTSVTPFGTSTVVWNVGTVAPGATETLVLDAELQDANVATFRANSLASNMLNQNVSQVTAMTEDDTDSTVNSHTITDPSTFDSSTSEDDEDDAFVFLPPILGDYVWNDLDNDGLQDVGEPGINGVTVNLYLDVGPTGPDVGDTLVATTTTADIGSGDGFYIFGNLTAGVDYWVEFDHSSTALTDFVPTAQGPAVDPLDASDSDGDASTGWTELHNLSAGEERLTVDQGYVQLLAIGNLVWEDRDNDGDVDSGEPGLAGVVVELYVDSDASGDYSVGDAAVSVTGSNSVTPGQAVTDVSGAWTFGGLLPGEYVVRIPDVNGDTGGNYVSSTGNTNALTGVVGSFEPAPDVDVVSADNDDNGQAGAGLSHVSQAVTLAYNTEPTIDGDSSTYTEYSVDMGFFTPFSIGNRVWLDDGNTTGTANNGIQDGDETGIATVTVRLYAATDTGFTTPLTSAITDGSGYYRFDDLTPGDYVVEVVQSTLPTGAVSSTLEATASSPDLRDHGQNTLNTNGNTVSHSITLGYGLQPSDETDISTGNGAESPHGNSSSDLAIDFGFALASDVSVDKQVDSATYTLGTADTRTYTFVVTNNGPVDATAISVVDAEPAASVSFSSWSCAITTAGVGSLTESCASANGSGSINETVTLNSGGTATYTITAAVGNTTSGTVTNTVTVALPPSLVQSVTDLPDTDSVDITPLLQTPSISLDKQLYEGHDSGLLCNTASAVDQLVIVDKTQSSKDITYCFTVTNNGNTYLDTITLSDPTLSITEANMTLHPSSDPSPLAPGNSQTFYYDTATNTSIDNTATTDAQPTLFDSTPTGQPNVDDTDSNAILVYVFDPPFGQKTGTLDGGQTIISWDMVWINDAPIQADGVVITDEPPVDTTYYGNLVCSPQGASTVSSCVYEAPTAEYPRGRVVVDADIAADPGATTEDTAANEVVVSFDVLIDNPDIETSYENQAEIEWQGITGTSDDPTVGGNNDPAVVQITTLSETGQSQLASVAVGSSLITLVLVVAALRPSTTRVIARIQTKK